MVPCLFGNRCGSDADLGVRLHLGDAAPGDQADPGKQLGHLLVPFFLGPRCPDSLTKHLDPVKGGRLVRGYGIVVSTAPQRHSPAIYSRLRPLRQNDKPARTYQIP